MLTHPINITPNSASKNNLHARENIILKTDFPGGLLLFHLFFFQHQCTIEGLQWLSEPSPSHDQMNSLAPGHDLLIRHVVFH